MQSSMYHPGEDPQRTMYRVMFWLTILMNSGLFIWGLAATYFAYNASWTPFPLSLLGLFSVLNVGFYGDYAMNRRVKSDMYRFLTIQYFLSAFTLIIAAFAFVQIDQVRGSDSFGLAPARPTAKDPVAARKLVQCMARPSSGWGRENPGRRCEGRPDA